MTNLTIFHDEMAGLPDERKAVNIHPDFSKAFGPASHNIPLEKIMEYGLAEVPVKWTGNCVNI